MTEATFARINMQVELSVMKLEQLEQQGGATTKIHLAVDAHGLRLILKTLEVKSMTVKLRVN